MTACGWCHGFVGGVAERCLFPGSDECATQRRKEDEAHAINDSYKLAADELTAETERLGLYDTNRPVISAERKS